MLARRFISLFKGSQASQIRSGVKSLDEGKSKSFGRKAVSFVSDTVTGGVALSALDDLAIYHGCSRYFAIYLAMMLLGFQKV
ncbi:hypothetical protein NC653_033984 [Populus alba x Populus x berolinensis]|nr:hypothetical protein NC653_033984 [Populus alba x Populus x berolinensis]